MREVKFRAWNPDNPNTSLRMVVNPLHRCDAKNVLEKQESYKNWTLMQFTGLLDKSGKEIYEGDIVFCKVRDSGDKEYEGSYEIYWGKDFGYCFREKDYEHGLPLSWTGYESIEVIGNIYEDTNHLKEHGANNN